MDSCETVPCVLYVCELTCSDVWGGGGGGCECAAVHLRQLEQTDETVRRCLQTDGQTWAQLCVSVQCYSEVRVTTFASGWGGWGGGGREMETDRDSDELSRAHVHKPECETSSDI